MEWDETLSPTPGQVQIPGPPKRCTRSRRRRARYDQATRGLSGREARWSGWGMGGWHVDVRGEMPPGPELWHRRGGGRGGGHVAVVVVPADRRDAADAADAGPGRDGGGLAGRAGARAARDGDGAGRDRPG